MVDRRTVLLGTLAAGLAGPALAQTAAPARTFEVIPLWPGRPPGGEAVTVEQREVLRTPTSPPGDVAIYGITRPTLTLVRPDKPNGMAMLMVPGGGYERIATSAGGGSIAQHFASRGFLVGVLLYRLPYDGWAAGPDAPLQDAQRAFRMLRREAGAGAKVGVIGFSAGGHLGGSLAARFAEQTYAPLDALDRGAARPDFAGLFFPVVTMTDPYAHGPSRRNLIGREPGPERIARWSIERSVHPAMPPTFVAAAADDRVVPVENSMMLFASLRRNKVPSAIHIFDEGGHGFGAIGDPAGPGRFWPDLFVDWLGRQKL
jgi:acetyl esterase/lipase